jgi:hypothetical protein
MLEPPFRQLPKLTISSIGPQKAAAAEKHINLTSPGGGLFLKQMAWALPGMIIRDDGSIRVRKTPN